MLLPSGRACNWGTGAPSQQRSLFGGRPCLHQQCCPEQSRGLLGSPSRHSTACQQRRRLAAATSDAVELAICEGEAQFPRLQSGASLKQGPRETMEDFLCVQDAPFGFLFAAVYDGHNGDSAAKYLVQHLCAVFESLLEEQKAALGGSSAGDSAVCYPIKIQNTLTESFRKTDAKLLEWMRQYAPAEEANSGSTATAALVRRDAVIVANVGDSRAVLCRGGQAVDLTTPHRVHGRGEAVAAEIKRVQEAGGWVHDGRVCGVIAVSRAFGDPEFKFPGLEGLLERGAKDGLWTQEFASSRRFTDDPVTVEPDVSVVALGPQDEFLLVATDGLWDVLAPQDAINLARTNLRKGLSPQEVAEKMVGFALKRYTADNVAVVVVDLAQEGGSAGGGSGKAAGAAGNGGGKKKGGLFGMFG